MPLYADTADIFHIDYVITLSLLRYDIYTCRLLRAMPYERQRYAIIDTPDASYCCRYAISAATLMLPLYCVYAIR